MGGGRGRASEGEAPAEVKTDDLCEDDLDEHVRWATRAWPEIDPDVEAIVTRIDGAQRYLDRAMVESLDEVGLTHGEFRTLLRLTRGVRSQGDVAKSLLISTGTMTNRLDKLEEEGLVRRLPDPSDRRGKLVEMTPEGRDRLTSYINLQAKRERQLLNRLGAADRKALIDLLRKLLASLNDESGRR